MTSQLDLNGLIPNQETYCITGITQETVGQVTTLNFQQENCPQSSVSFTVNSGDEGSVECCNTNATATVNVNNKTLDLTIQQSVGADVTAQVPLNELAQAIFGVEERNDECDEYNVITLCGQDFLEVPIRKPITDCKCLIVPAGFSGQVTVRIEDTGTTQTVDWGENNQTSQGPSGSDSVYTYAESDEARIITVCNDNPCNGMVSRLIYTPDTLSCGCCDC